MAHDTTSHDTILDDLHWVHCFPAGAGAVAPGGRAYRFNGGELRPRPLSAVAGLTWVGEGVSCEHPDITLGWQYPGTNNQWHQMGLETEGFPMRLHVLVVDDVQAAFAMAHRAVRPTGAPCLLREWMPVMVHAADSTRLALHVRAWDRNGEVQFRNQVMQAAGLRYVLDLLPTDVPFELLAAPRRAGDLIVRGPGMHMLRALPGNAFESLLEPCGWLRGAVNRPDHADDDFAR
ncbi:MAG: hypothetical protein ACKPDI_06360 [Actinomycetota bacterium]